MLNRFLCWLLGHRVAGTAFGLMGAKRSALRCPRCKKVVEEGL